MKKTNSFLPGLCFLLFAFILFYSCSKSHSDAPGSATSKNDVVKSTDPKTPSGTGRLAPNCYYPSPLAWTSSSQLQGTYGPITLIVDNPYWPISCSDGTPITLQDYLPFYGTVSIAGSEGVVNMQPGVTNQFVLSIGVWNPANGEALSDSINSFLTAWQNWTFGSGKPYPDVANYVPAATASTITVTGKLVRLTTGSTFGAVGTCYPNVFPCNQVEVEKMHMQHK